MMCKGILPRFQEPLQLDYFFDWAGRYVEVMETVVGASQTAWVDAIWTNTCMCDGAQNSYEQVLTTMTLPTNMVYTKKSPGCEKRLDSRSIELPYWYKKYGSSRMPNFGFVRRNAEKSRQSCGIILVVKTY